jgi:hypothetical protein
MRYEIWIIIWLYCCGILMTHREAQNHKRDYMNHPAGLFILAGWPIFMTVEAVSAFLGFFLKKDES